HPCSHWTCPLLSPPSALPGRPALGGATGVVMTPPRRKQGQGLALALPITTRACRHKAFSCSAAISVATFSTQMAQNLCHSSPTKTFLHFMQFFALGFRAGRSRFARQPLVSPLENEVARNGRFRALKYPGRRRARGHLEAAPSGPQDVSFRRGVAAPRQSALCLPRSIAWHWIAGAGLLYAAVSVILDIRMKSTLFSANSAVIAIGSIHSVSPMMALS